MYSWSFLNVSTQFKQQNSPNALIGLMLWVKEVVESGFPTSDLEFLVWRKCLEWVVKKDLIQRIWSCYHSKSCHDCQRIHWDASYTTVLRDLKSFSGWKVIPARPNSRESPTTCRFFWCIAYTITLNALFEQTFTCDENWILYHNVKLRCPRINRWNRPAQQSKGEFNQKKFYVERVAGYSRESSIMNSHLIHTANKTSSFESNFRQKTFILSQQKVGSPLSW